MASPLNKTIRLSAKEKLRQVPRLPKKIVASTSGIFCGEVLESLRRMPDKYFDLIIVDPPYNLGVDFGNDSDSRSQKEYHEWIRTWVSMLPIVAKPNASIYICTDWRQSSHFHAAIEHAGFFVLNRITWKRDKGRGAAKNSKQNMEDIWYAVVDTKSYTFNLEQVKVAKKVIAPYRVIARVSCAGLGTCGEPAQRGQGEGRQRGAPDDGAGEPGE